MPPFRLGEIKQAQQEFGNAYFPVEEYEQLPNTDETFEVPDDIRAIAIRSIVRATTGEATFDRESIASQLQMTRNIEGFITDREAGMDVSMLREHQHDVFHDIAAFIAQPLTREDGSLDRSGFIKLPTGTGKTAVFTTLVEVLHGSPESDEHQLKSLVLVPKLDLVSQTVGKDGERGFAQFAPNTRVTEYHGQKKDLSGDAVVMTYRSFNKMVRSGTLPADLFNIVICDEAHNALGRQVKESIEAYCADKLLLGLTATPDYAENKKLSDLFSKKVHSMELREAIEEGFLSSVQCFAVTSDEEIKTISRGAKDFTEKELEKLITSEWRNTKAVEFATWLVSEGKQGIVSCVPGSDLAHAKLMAEKLNDAFVQDKFSGELRRIRARSIGSATSPEERQEIYEQFEAGEIDVLTYVDMLTEGWDSQRAKFIINLRPTISPVSAVQRMGRVLRPTDDGEIATIIEFIDESEKPQFTFYHALGEEEIILGKIFGSTSSPSGGMGNGPDLGELPDDILERLFDIDHRIIGELIVQPDLALGGVLSASAFSKNYHIGNLKLERIVEDLGLELESYFFGQNRRHALGLTPEQQAQVLAHPFVQRETAQDGAQSLYGFATSIGVSRELLTSVVSELGIDPDVFYFGSQQQEAFGLTVDQQDLVQSYIDEHYPMAPEGSKSINVLAKELNSSHEQLYKVCDELGIVVKQLRLPGDKKGYRISPGLTDDEIVHIKEHPFYEVPEITEDVTRIDEIVRTYRMQYKKIHKILDELGIKPGKYREGGHRIVGLSSEQLAMFSSNVLASPPEGTTRIGEFCEQYNVSRTRLAEITEELGVRLTRYRFVFKKGAREDIGLSEAEKQAVLSHPYFEAPNVDDTITSHYQATQELGVGPDKLNTISKDLGIEPKLYRSRSTRKLSLGFSADELQQIKAHPYFQYDPHPAQVSRQPQVRTPQVEKTDVPTRSKRSERLEAEGLTLIYKVAKQMQVDPSKVEQIVSELGLEPVIVGRSSSSSRGVQPLRALNKEQIEAIKNHPHFAIPFAGELDAESLDSFTRTAQVSPKKLKELIDELQIEPEEYKFRSRKSYTVGRGLTNDQRQRILSHPHITNRPLFAPEGVVALGPFVQEIGSSRPTVIKVAERIGIILGKYRFGSNGTEGIGLTEEQRQAIKSHIARADK